MQGVKRWKPREFQFSEVVETKHIGKLSCPALFQFNCKGMLGFGVSRATSKADFEEIIDLSYKIKHGKHGHTSSIEIRFVSISANRGVSRDWN